MNFFTATISIEKTQTGRYSKSTKFVLKDSNGGQLALLDSLYDAGICLRFLMGKSMSRTECDLAEAILKNADEGSKCDEQNTGKAVADDEK